MPETITTAVLSETELAETLIDIRRHLHQYPETGFDEFETSRYLRDFLEARDFETIGPLGTTGFAVEVEGAHPGPTVAYRAELDGLPTPDAKEVPYASKVAGVAHLCGHDVHAAIAIGVTMLLRERREQLHGTVRVLFQPNEESIPTGAPRVIADGGIEGVQEIFCVHADPTLDVGRIGLRAGPITAATASWMVHVLSDQSGHSARPHETPDTIWIANQILTSFFQLAGRVHDARRTAVLTACRFHAGQAINVIPAEVDFGGTLRSTDIESLRHLNRRMEDVAEAVGSVHGATIRYEADLSLPAVINDPDLVQVISQAAEDLLGSGNVFWIPKPSMGGEDFAFYLEHVPGVLVRLGTRSSDRTAYPLHHSLFDVDESAIPLAARLMSEVLARRLGRIVQG